MNVDQNCTVFNSSPGCFRELFPLELCALHDIRLSINIRRVMYQKIPFSKCYQSFERSAFSGDLAQWFEKSRATFILNM